MPDKLGHLDSRDPETGMQLKGKAHPTYRKGIEVDEGLGYREEKREDGRYYTVPRYSNGGPVRRYCNGGPVARIPHHHKGR